MTASDPASGNVQLRYGMAKVFEQPDTRAPEVGELARNDAFSVLSAEGEYYHIQLSNGSRGFVYAHNLVGTDLPLTAIAQATADRRTAEAAQSSDGWRGAIKRRFGR